MHKAIYFLIGIAIFICGASYVFYKVFADFAVYEVTPDGQREVYRSIDSKKARREFERLRSSKDGKMYILMDEGTGNSVLPY